MGPMSKAAGIFLLAILTIAAVVIGVLSLSSVRDDYRAGETEQRRGIGSSIITTVSTVSVGGALERRALDYTREVHLVLSGTPQVLLSRDLTMSDLLSLGTCGESHPANDPRYRLVVVRADLDLSNMPGVVAHSRSVEDRRAGFIAYVYDSSTQSMAPVAEYTSRNGGAFRKILDDPTLPDDVPPAAPPGTKQDDLSLDPGACMQIPNPTYPPGQIMPTAPIPVTNP